MKTPKDIDKLIDAAIADGELEEKEIKALRKKAEADGLNPDEVELDARGRLSVLKKKEEKKASKWLLIGLLVSFCILGVWGLTAEDPKVHNNSEKCIAAVTKSISNNKLDKAEYYIKSFKYAGNEWHDLPSNVVENLVQAYIDNGEIDKAVSLSKWSWQYVGKPVYEYYMSNEEYLLADEFIISTDYDIYYNYMERAVTNMVLRGKISEARAFVTAKSVKFDDVEEIWREERKHTSLYVADCDKKYKPYFKLTVVNNLMAIINSSTIDEN